MERWYFESLKIPFEAFLQTVIFCHFRRIIWGKIVKTGQILTADIMRLER